FYLHIPKTGGITLGWRLASAFAPDETHVNRNGFYFPKDLEAFRLVVQTKRFAESHIGGPMLRDFNDLELMITVRDPVEQILSYWRHIQRDNTNSLHRAVNKLHYREFFDRIGDYFTDSQSTYFAGKFIPLGPELQR